MEVMSKQSVSPNGDQPASQHDLELWGGQLMTHIIAVGERVDKVESQLDRMEETQDKILDAVHEIKAALKGAKSLPARVERLERDRGWIA